MTYSYSSRLTMFEGGERFPILINNATGLPNPTALFYVLFKLRPKLRSWRTIDAALRAVGMFLEYNEEMGIDLHSRFCSGRYLDPIELDRLSARLQATRRAPAIIRSTASCVPGTEAAGRWRSAETLAIIVAEIAKFVGWLIEFWGRQCWSTLAERRDGELLGQTFLARLRGITPRGGGGSKRLSLDEDQRALLLAATAVDAGSSFARRRTRHWCDWGISEGHRCGELLNLRLSDIDLETGAYFIRRNPDAADDPRRDQPLVKGLARGLQLTPWMTLEARSYVFNDRAGCPFAAEHDLYFVASSGWPLSRSSVTKQFATLRAEHPALGKGLCHHVLRHTRVRDFDLEAKRLGYTKEETSRARAYAMGWRDEGSAHFYQGRETALLSHNVSLGLQDRHMAQRGGVK